VCEANTPAGGAGDAGVGGLRITVTAGRSPLGSARGTGPPTVVVAPFPARDWPATSDVVVVPWPRSERSAVVGLKTTSYAENVVAYAYAADHGAGEAIFGNLAGNLCEGTGSNVFVGLDGRLVTPPLSSGCLAGVTRALLLELGVAEEADVLLERLGSAGEAFLSSTTRNVQPIANVDGAPLRSIPGDLTLRASEALHALIARDLDP
jgi:branched-chain amino acid aminotransferase